jgi:ABC-2 type transport system permease protein
MPMVVRLLRLWRLYAWLDLTWMLRDLASFVMTIIADAVTVLSLVTAMLLLAQRFDGLGPWTPPQITFLLGYAVLVRGVLETAFGYNIVFISRRIGRGQLDHILVQPQPIWTTLLTEGFSPAVGIPIILTGIGLLLWGASQLELSISFTWTAILVLNLVASTSIVVSFSYIVGSLAFWAPRAAEEVNSSSWRLIHQLSNFPLDGIGGVLLGGLLSAVPVGFVAWFPCRALLGLAPAWYASLLTPLAAVCFGALAFAVFTQGMLQYGRTGSQRYLSWGHRR